MREVVAQTLQRFMWTYARRPAQLIVRHLSLVPVVALLIIVTQYTDQLQQVLLESVGGNSIFLSGHGRLFSLTTAIIGTAVSQWQIVLAVVTLLWLQIVTNLFIAQDLALIYQRSRSSLFLSLRTISLSKFIWYSSWCIAVYVVYILAAGLAYIGFALFWRATSIDLSLGILLIIALLYPFLYAFISLGSKMAALPFESRYRISRLLRLCWPAYAVKVYSFFGIALIAQFVLYIGVPIALALLVRNPVLEVLILIVAISIPLSIVRASFFEFFLHIYRDETRFRSTFAVYYSEQSSA
jgi:hypothetical protein